MKFLIAFFITILGTFEVFAENQEIESFSKAKKVLEKQVYNNHRSTLYCGAEFNSHKKVTTPKGFTTTKYLKRAQKIEWEHVVPAENFGRTFSEWRDGHSQCVSSRGKCLKVEDVRRK